MTRIYRELKKLKSQKFNAPIKKRATELNRTFTRVSNGQKSDEKMLTISRHKGNANKNHGQILPHPC
jgi:CRISPR/Cas system Type II protein with McrA/HNH and RuvC-like nuclease domain